MSDGLNILREPVTRPTKTNPSRETHLYLPSHDAINGSVTANATNTGAEMFAHFRSSLLLFGRERQIDDGRENYQRVCCAHMEQQ